MKKIHVLIVVLSLFCVTFLFTGASFAAQEFKPMTLRFADVVPEKSFYGELHKWWASEVEKRTGGKIKVQIFWMESLVKWKDMLEGVQSGMADVGWITATYHPSKLPMWFMLDNVFNFRKDYIASILASIETIENEPNLKAEFEKHKIFLLGSHISGQAQTGLRKNLNSVNDLKGKTLRTVGGAKTIFWQNLGANPVFMAFGELYEALDRGTIDGIGDCAISLANTFKLYEVVKTMYMAEPGGVVAGGLCINTDVYKKIPKDLQKVLIDLRHDYGIRYAQMTMDLEAVLYKEWQTKHGVKVQYPTPDDQKIIEAAGQKANAAHIKTQESAGHLASQKVWDYYLAALKKHEDARAKKN
jgi:TRAP-type C4-dicarboxylate transport system substrate-binding protein